MVADVADQLRLGHAGALKTYRGPLGRESLRLEVVELPAQADRLAWLATHLPELPGSGIVYTLTKRDADTVAEWLNGHGVPAEAYSGEVDTARRVNVEERLLRNELKAVVATSALGMGYDKPDLGFVVHYQAPGSVISYYQQVGRAGRAIDRADVVLLRGREDRRIQDFFIEQAFPPKDRVDRVLEALDDERRDDQRADGRRQPRQGPDRGDAEGARRRGRGHPRGHEVGARAGQRTGTTTATATPTSRSCAATSRRRWRRSAPTAAA